MSTTKSVGTLYANNIETNTFLVAEDITIGNSIHISGSQTVTGNINVNGTIQSNTLVVNTSTVSGPQIVTGELNVGGSSNISGGSTVAGNVDIGGSLHVNGNIIFNGNISGSLPGDTNGFTPYDDLSVGNLDVSGTLNIKSLEDVSGDAGFTKILYYNPSTGEIGFK